MKLSIEEIEKLDRERTQGEWQAGYSTSIQDGNKVEHYPFVRIGNMTYECDLPDEETINNQFIAAAPTIAAQYIKARRLEVTEEFVNNVLESLQKKTGYYHGKDYWGIKQETISEAFKVMWKEVEGET